MTANPGDTPTANAAATTQGQAWIPADTFAVRLLLVRRHMDMTIEEIAELCGFIKSSWANWENGRRPQQLVEVCQTISDRTGCDFNWLLLGGPLLSARGKPTGRTGGDTDRYSKLASVQPEPDFRPTPDRPKSRTDRTSPMAGKTGPRRAAPVR